MCVLLALGRFRGHSLTNNCCVQGVIDNVFPKELLAIQAMYLSSSERKKHGDQLAVERFSKALTVYTLQVQRDVRSASDCTQSLS